MKKLLYLLVGFSLFLLGACSNEQGPVQDGSGDSMLIGVLELQTINDSLKGTHLIIGDDGERTAVRSLSVNLSSKKYLNNKIEALGVMNDLDNVFEINGLTVLDVLSEDSVIADLVEYKNSEFGFKFKYYNDWTAEEDQSEVVFTAPAQDDLIGNASVKISHLSFIYDPEGTSDVTYASPLEAYFMEEMGINPLDKIIKIGPDQLEAVKMEIDAGPIEYTLYRAGLIYKIQFFPSKNPGYDEEKRVFSEMVSAFQFIGFEVENDLDPESATSEVVPVVIDEDLTYFESLPYSFRGVYPTSWYYAGTLSSNSGVLHHYGFGTEPVDANNEILSLEVIDSSLFKSGSKVSMNGKTLDVVNNGDIYTVYVKVDDRYFKLQGPVEHKDLILNMASNINHIEPVY